MNKTPRDRQQYRILVVGKTGCGKSSLINRVLGAEVANVSHTVTGNADMEKGFRPNNNTHFILHDSKGFLPGEEDDVKNAQAFIAQRTKAPEFQDRLHAIWVCCSIPRAGDRTYEAGVESIIKAGVDHQVPIILIFTKYDMLVTHAMFMSQGKPKGQPKIGSAEWEKAERKAAEEFDPLKTQLTRRAQSLGGIQVPVVEVSTRSRYNRSGNSIEQLIQLTDQEIQRHLQPGPLARHHERNALDRERPRQPKPANRG